MSSSVLRQRLPPWRFSNWGRYVAIEALNNKSLVMKHVVTDRLPPT